MDNTDSQPDSRIDFNRENARLDPARATLQLLPAFSSNSAHLAPRLASSAVRLAKLITRAFLAAVVAALSGLAYVAPRLRSLAVRLAKLITGAFLAVVFVSLSTTRQHLAAVSSNLAYVSTRLASAALRLAKWITWTFLGATLVALSAALTMLWALFPVPLEEWSRPNRSAILVEAANGDRLGRIGPFVQRAEFPELLLKAVLSIEDRRYFTHWGIDPWGIARATLTGWSASAKAGTTITQQLANMQLVGSDRSLGSKLREAFTAVWLDLRLSKDEILTRYLNSIYLGAGAYGMPAGARIYFDKSLSELTLSDSAMLAGFIQAPSRHDPTRDLDAAQRRAVLVLDAMVETGAIDSNLADVAKANPATTKVSPDAVRSGSWFADWIAKRQLPKIAGSIKRTVRVRTTLEPNVQRMAERAVSDALSRPGDARGPTEGALIAMRPDGSVIAMVGGRDHDESQFNRAADAQRQAGSIFTVFAYYAALRNGISPDIVVDASPVAIDEWRLEDHNRGPHDRMTLSQAFVQSVNTVAARLRIMVGLKEVIVAARELGFDVSLKDVPSIALGSNKVTLLDLTSAFASIRAGRAKLKPWGITGFASGQLRLRSLAAPAVAEGELPQKEQLTGLLREVVEHGTGRAAAINGANVAGKTGTSQDHRDAWFVGFSDDVVVGVWVGNDDANGMKGVTGGSLPAQIWKSFVTAATPLIVRSNKPEVVEGAEASPSRQALSQPQCNQSACAARYNAFRAPNCTYQPYSGPRRLCEVQGGRIQVGRKDGRRGARKADVGSKKGDLSTSLNDTEQHAFRQGIFRLEKNGY